MNRNQVSSLVRLPRHRKGLAWEQPLGTIRGFLDEPPQGFVDPYEQAEREAIQEVGNVGTGNNNKD